MPSWWTTFLDFFYPPKCLGCKTQVFEQGAWCSACVGKIVAPRFIDMSQHRLAFLDSCWTVCEYTGFLKRIIHDMKFRHEQRYAISLQWLIREYSQSFFPNTHLERFSSSDCVIPVPLHRQRLKERGYNQAECIFKAWARERQMLWLPKVLERRRDTVPQWELKLIERKKNMKGAFVVLNPEQIKNKNIILVDDIFTTGITLDECAKALKQAGASKVYALVVASGAH